MRVGFVSDAHGNVAGLDRALHWLDRLGAERVYFLGDAVGYLMDAGRVLDRLEREAIACQKGNHEAMMLEPTERALRREAVYRLQETRDALGAEALARISSWPIRREVRLGERRALLVHGSPRDPLFDYVYPDSDLRPFAETGYDAVLMGNTHIPFVRSEGSTVFVNVGSVGLPRDRGDAGSFALFDSLSEEYRIYRFDLDVRSLAQSPELDPSVRACFTRRSDAVFGEMLS